MSDCETLEKVTQNTAGGRLLLAICCWKRNIIFLFAATWQYLMTPSYLSFVKWHSLYRYPIMNHKKIFYPYKMALDYIYTSLRIIISLVHKYDALEYFTVDFHCTLRQCFEEMAIQRTNRNKKHSSAIKTFYFSPFTFLMFSRFCHNVYH